MIGVIVTIGPGDDLNRQRANAIAEQEGPKFEGMAGLQSKVFMWDDEAGTVTNTYLWDSEEAARAFFTPARSLRVGGRLARERDLGLARTIRSLRCDDDADPRRCWGRVRGTTRDLRGAQLHHPLGALTARPREPKPVRSGRAARLPPGRFS